MNKLSQARNVIKHRLPGAPNSWTLEIFCWCFWSALWSRINMVAEDGNFYFRKTSLGTGFSAWTVYWILATVYRHPRYWAATINWNGQKRQSAVLIYNPTSPIIGPVGHYFTPGLSWSTRKSSTACLSKHKVNIFQTMLKNIIDSRCGFNIKETQVCVCVSWFLTSPS